MLEVAKAASISPGVAKKIIDEVRAIVDRWPDFADEAGLPASRAKALDRILNGR